MNDFGSFSYDMIRIINLQDLYIIITIIDNLWVETKNWTLHLIKNTINIIKKIYNIKLLSFLLVFVCEKMECLNLYIHASIITLYVPRVGCLTQITKIAIIN